MANGKNPPLSNDDIDPTISKEKVQEILVSAKSLIPLLAGCEDIDPKIKASYAAKVVTMPTVTTSMSRKVNTGDYENLDFFFSVQVPLSLTDDEAQLHDRLCRAAIQQGIDIVNPEVNERYAKVKEKVRERQNQKP